LASGNTKTFCMSKHTIHWPWLLFLFLFLSLCVSVFPVICSANFICCFALKSRLTFAALHQYFGAWWTQYCTPGWKFVFINIYWQVLNLSACSPLRASHILFVDSFCHPSKFCWNLYDSNDCQLLVSTRCVCGYDHAVNCILCVLTSYIWPRCAITGFFVLWGLITRLESICKV